MTDYNRFYHQFDSDDLICYGQCEECDRSDCELNDEHKGE